MGQTVFPDVVLRPVKVFYDDRGCFMELFRHSDFGLMGLTAGAGIASHEQCAGTSVQPQMPAHGVTLGDPAPSAEEGPAVSRRSEETNFLDDQAQPAVPGNGAQPGLGTAAAFVQDNFSVSRYGVIRGLHYQRTYPQGKLVQVLAGKVFDVVVDVRQGSPGFGQWQSFELDAAQPSQLWVPPGYAHGFAVLSAEAALLYKCTRYYQPGDEVTLRWDDPEVAIDWPLSQPVLSAKDAAGLGLAEIRQQGLAVALPFA